MKDSRSKGLGREDWLVDLGRAALSVERRKRHEITIRWFLGWCRRQRLLVEPTREAARRFYLEKVRERNAAGWQKSGWGGALRWYMEWRESKANMRQIWQLGTVACGCRRHWDVSIRAQKDSGSGNGCFPRANSAKILGVKKRGGIM